MFSALAAGLPAFAQEAVDEVIVTAQRREQNVQDVGIAINALSGSQLRELGVTDSTTLSQQVPGLVYASPIGDGQNPIFSIRGVGLNDFSEHNEAPIAVYVDDVYLSNLAGLTFQLFDLERVEVLKGPQGTLFGRNTTGGVIHFVTRKPSKEFEARSEVNIGEHSLFRFEGAMGGPLSDTTRFRLAALYNKSDGYTNILSPGFKDANAADSTSVRGQLEFEPSDALTFRLTGHYDRSKTESVAYHHASIQTAPDGVSVIFVPPDRPNGNCPGDPGADCFGYRYSGAIRSAEIDREPFLDLQTWGGSGTLQWNFSNDVTLTSISAYEHVDKLYGEDTDAGSVPGIYVTHPNQGKQYSEELRLANDNEKLRWTAGLYYFNRSIDAGSNIDVSGIGLFNLLLKTNDDIRSWAAFGQLEYALSDSVRLIGGLRYTNEKRHFQEISRDLAGVIPVFIGASATPEPGFVTFDFTDASVGSLTRKDDDAVNYRAEIDWHATDALMWYGSVSLGSKGAGFNAAFDGTGVFSGSTIGQIPFGKEQLTNYEAGFKSTWGESTLFNASTFYYDYKDFQAFTFDNLTQVIRNLPASMYGAEAELSTRPVQGLLIKTGVAYLHTNVQDVAANNSLTGTPTVRNRQMALAPKLQLSLMTRYQWALGRGTLSAQASGHYQSSSYFDLDNNPVTREPGYGTVDARLAYIGGDERYEVALWGKNVTDKVYRSYAFPVASLGFMDETIARPRWFGVSFGYRLK
ncbi:MAG: TonB-dependent receptor [Gammaproteobacteria bacterium]